MTKRHKHKTQLALSLGLTAAAMSAFFLGPGAASTSASDSGSGICCDIGPYKVTCPYSTVSECCDMCEKIEGWTTGNYNYKCNGCYSASDCSR
jgi:hypothetical protein